MRGGELIMNKETMFQDGTTLPAQADAIRDLKVSILKDIGTWSREKLLTGLSQGQAWWGPNSEQFKNEWLQTYSDVIVPACENLEIAAQELEEHQKKWNEFESQGL